MKIRTLIDKVSHFIDGVESSLCFVLLVLTVIVGFLQVFCRSVLHAALPWSEELLRFCFVWLIFMGAGLGINAGAHLSVEFFTSLIPERARRFLSIVSLVLVLVFCNQVFLRGVTVVQTAYSTNMHSSAMRIPMWIPYLGVCFPFCLMQLQVLSALLKRFFPDLNREEADAQ